jgi:peptidoglycan/xylan/chitin deacetylase (PgdA/CDA1 family)
MEPAKPTGAAAASFEAVLGEQLGAIQRSLPADRLTVVFDTSGHDGAVGGSREELSFSAAMARAGSAGALPSFDERTNAERFSYRVGGGPTHEVSFPDALSTWNGATMVRKRGVTRIGVRKLGEEDPSLWRFLGVGSSPAPSVLAQIPPLDSVRVLEEGEVYSVRERPRAGQRRVDVLADGRVSGGYTALPAGYEVDGLRASGKEIALTFDDGPDERNTGRLLDVLREFRVPATFFVVGNQALKARELVKREASEGHQIGIHSFTHPHFEALTPAEAEEEIESTRELLVGLVGSRSVLFRAPYEPYLRLGRATDRAILDMAVRNDCSYIGGLVNSDDWQRKGADVIAARVIADVTAGVGKVVVLHDGGGDRSQTVAAVREFVPELRRQGFEFVGLDRLFRHRLVDVQGTVTRAP